MHGPWYAVGWLGGLYEERLDVLAAFASDPQPFVVAGSAATSLLSGWLVWRLGRELLGPTAGVVGAVFLGVMFAHVRESYHVWPGRHRGDRRGVGERRRVADGLADRR